MIGEFIRRPRYRSPMSGECICGHKWSSHHLGVILNPEYIHTSSGPEYYIPQECEAFGFNETGGLDHKGLTHCEKYKDKLDIEWR